MAFDDVRYHEVEAVESCGLVCRMLHLDLIVQATRHAVKQLPASCHHGFGREPSPCCVSAGTLSGTGR